MEGVCCVYVPMPTRVYVSVFLGGVGGGGIMELWMLLEKFLELCVPEVWVCCSFSELSFPELFGHPEIFVGFNDMF